MAGTPQAPTEFDVGRLDIVVSRDQIAPSVPGQPAQGAVTQNSITISWSASTDTGGSGLKGYDVERNGSVIATEVPTTSYVDTGLSSGATYTYRVRARDNAENVSAFSPSRNITTADTTAPTVPVISAAALSETQIRISLVTPSTDAGSGLRDYTLQVSSTGTSGWSNLATALQDASFPYTHGGLSAGTQRFYRLQAFDHAANSSTSAVVNATAQAAGLNWIGGNDTTTDIPATVGTPVDFDVAAQVVGEQSIALVSGSVPGLTYNPGTMRITGTPTTANAPTGANLVFDANDGQGSGPADALTDWNARIGGAGVLWAHRFQSAANDIQGWQHSSTSYIPERQQFIANGGIIPGDGALRQVYEGGADWGGGSWRWCRPIQPMVGDINQPGVATLAKQPSYYWFQNQVIASVMHADYQAAHGSPPRTGPFLCDDIYFQLWIKLSPGRTLDANAPGGKLVMFESAYQNTSNELVMTVGPGSRRIGSLYANKGSGFNSGLEDPQASGGSNSGRRQPGSTYSIPSGSLAGQSSANVCTFNNGTTYGWQNACWTWPENEWVNWLIRFKPGHQYVTTPVESSANDPVRDTTITTWAATATDIREGRGYTRIHHKTDYVWEYDDALRFGAGSAYQPYGINWFSLNHFTGGNNWVVTPLTFWHQFDQIICSLQPIPCPTWAPET